MIDRPRHKIALILLALVWPMAAMAAPGRIVSLNLCADQYLIALADPGQIAALTQFARDPEMSFAVARAAALPTSRSSAEEVLALKPDLIIAAPYQRADMRALFKDRDVVILDLPPAESYAEIAAQARLIARAIGHPERGESLVRRMGAALAALPARPPGPVAAYYQRRGYLTGTGTLVDGIMRRAGLRNLARRLGRPALSQLSIEEMVAARPDWLIVETTNDRIDDQGTEMLQHPALAAIPRLRLPSAATICGGPSYPAAVSSLIAQMAEKRR